MTELERALAAFTSVDLAAWSGLPEGVRLADLEPLLGFDATDTRIGEAGSPGRACRWVAAESPTYRGALRLWLDDTGEQVVLLEGLYPQDGDGVPLPVPELPAPDGVYDAVLGPLHVPDAERVYAGRGLAVQQHAEAGVLVAVLGFAPTTLADYRARLQPHRQPTRPLPAPMGVRT